jgi:hypothetical protein
MFTAGPSTGRTRLLQATAGLRRNSKSGTLGPLCLRSGVRRAEKHGVEILLLADRFRSG